MEQRILIIDEEFLALLEQHTTEEKEQLRKNIKADGRVIDPIVLWEGHDIIVDGMTRYSIALEEGVPFTTIDLPFADRASVKEWIFAHQVGRRNGDGLSRARWRAMLVEAKAAKLEPVRGSKTEAVRQVADANGMSERQVWRDTAVAEVLNSLPRAVKTNIDHGRISASVESIMRLNELPETQKSQVLDVLENLPPGLGDDLAFRSVDEVIEAVREHQEEQPVTESENKTLEKEMARFERMIQDTPGRIDTIARIKKWHRLPWKERVQVAFANFVAIWREQCGK